MADQKISDLTAIVTQSTTDLYETSLNGTGSRKETRAQQLSYTLANILSPQNFTYVALNGSNTAGSGRGNFNVPYADPYAATTALSGSTSNPQVISMAPGTYTGTALNLKPLVSYLLSNDSTVMSVTPTGLGLDSSWSAASNGSYVFFQNGTVSSAAILDFTTLTASGCSVIFKNTTVTGNTIIAGPVANQLAVTATNTNFNAVLNLQALNATLTSCVVGAGFTVTPPATNGNSTLTAKGCTFSSSVTLHATTTASLVANFQDCPVVGNISIDGTSGSTLSVTMKGCRNSGSITINGSDPTLVLDAISYPVGGFVFTGGATSAQITITKFSVVQGGTGVGSVTTTPTATAFAGWDANKNLSANNFLEGFTTTVTSGTPVVLTVASTYNQFFTGSTAQTVTLPVTSTLVQGHPFYIVNASTAVLTIQSSGGNTVATLPANSSGYVTCILTSGTTAASWSADATGTGTDVFPNGTVFVTSSTQTIVNGTVYAADGVGIVTFTLPGASFGSFFAIVGVNGWRLNIGSGQNVIIGSQTVTGPTNYWVSTNNNDAVMFEWTTSNTCQAISCVGNPQTNLGASALPYPSAGNGISVTLASGASVVSVVPITNTLSYNAGNIAWALGSDPYIYSAYTAVTGNATLSNPSNPVLGGVYTFVHTQATGTGPFTLSYGANYKFPQGIVPVITTTAGAVDILTFQYDGTLMRCIGISQNIS